MEWVRIQLNGYVPDMAPFDLPDGCLTEALNVFRTPRGVAPVPDLVQYNTTGNLGATEATVILKAKEFVASTGSCYIIAGTASKLYRINPDKSVDDVSKSGGYTATSWDFTQYGDWIIATASGNAVQVLKTMQSAVAFENLGGSPPQANYCMFNNGHLIIGSLTSLPKTIRWCAYENVELWTQSLTTGADSQLLADAIGNIVGIVPSGLNNFLIFTTGSIVSAQYIGSPYVYQFALIERERGALSNNLILSVGQSVVYWSSGDIYVFSGGQSNSIGAGIREWIFTDPDYGIDRTKLNQCACAYDENRDLAMFNYVNLLGKNKTLFYNPKTNAWSHSDAFRNGIIMFHPSGVLTNYPKIGSFQYYANTHNLMVETTTDYGDMEIGSAEMVLQNINTMSSVRLNVDKYSDRTDPEVTVYTRNNTYDEATANNFTKSNMGTYVGRATGRFFRVVVSGYRGSIGKGIQSLDVRFEEGVSEK